MTILMAALFICPCSFIESGGAERSALSYMLARQGVLGMLDTWRVWG